MLFKLLLICFLYVHQPPALGTTIAWDGKTMAADSRRTAAGTIMSDQIKKLRPIHGDIIGCAGRSDDIQSFYAWYSALGPYPIMSSGFEAMVLTKQGCFLYSDKPQPIEVKAPWAIGSGCDFALGAMHAGASARRAVEIAIDLDSCSGGSVSTLSLSDAEVRIELKKLGELK